VIELHNNYITVTNDEKIYNKLLYDLSFSILGRYVRLKNGKKVKTKDQIVTLYKLDEENGVMYIPSGILWLLEDKIPNYIDKRTYNNDKLLSKDKLNFIIKNIFDYKKIFIFN